MHGLTPSRVVLLSVVMGILVSFLSGCGGAAVHLSGKVTFKGQPVPAGKIYFSPDVSKGNSGPTGFATISNGAYSTSSSGGKETVGGALVVAIEGWDPSASGKAEKGDTSGEKLVKSLFARYETKIDMSNSNGTHDFQVPADAGIQKYKGETPVGGKKFINP